MAASVQSMCQYWKNFDLPELQKQLDTTATELASRQDESDASRKRLVEQSRDFKKNTPEDIRKVVAPLLKSFQNEVDALSKRSKAAEAAFLSVYKKLIDVPDPVSVLEHAQTLQKKIQKAGDLEIENKQLRETLEEYNNEFAEVKNQEVTIKTLREKLKEYEERMEANAQSRAKDKERELQRQFAEKERQLQETQLSVAKKLGEAEHKVATLQSALDSSQSEFFDLKAKYDEATSAKSDEMEMVMADLERANERAASAEREAERLKQHLASAHQNLQQAEQMQQAPDMEQAIDILKRSSLEVELAAKEKEIAQLVEDVQRLQGALTKLRETTSAQVAKLEEECASKSRAFQFLEDKIKTQEDYEEIKRELGVLKSIEFSQSGDKDGEGGEDQTKAKSLEVLLLEKNRALQTENTQLKVTNNDLTGDGASHPITNTDAFATMLGQEIVQSYQLHSRGSGSTTPASVPSTVENSTPAEPLTSNMNGLSIPHMPPSRHYHNGPMPHEVMDGLTLHRLQNISRNESMNTQTLDTAEVSQKIREILSTHNIGQRLFAKHVLGLSQGTVSELLSKPKHWDKLTEKGRESYRKMYAWASEEGNIMALKAISPKKGNAPVYTNYRQEDAATEERITQILNEAQQQMLAKNSHEKAQVATAMVSSIYQQELAKTGHMNHGSPHPPASSPGSYTSESRGHMTHAHEGSEHRGRRSQTDSGALSKEIVTRIYQEELAKLARAAEKSGNLAESTLYQQELARLAQNAQYHHIHDALLHPHHPHKRRDSHSSKTSDRSENSPLGNVPNIKEEPREINGRETPEMATDLSMKDKKVDPDILNHRHGELHMGEENGMVSHDSLRHTGSAFFLVRPRSNGQTPYDPAMSTILPEGPSPLQRMQSIANSIMAKSQTPTQSLRPLKAVLPPITQEQFDKYSNLNTDDLVKNVKETLSQFSISQRLFGENILGLSQGSVSDLLARPKPWNMLTQKGREPFIRMQIFLEDTEAIPRLVANQYRIPPDKLMRMPHNNNFPGNIAPTQSPEGSTSQSHRATPIHFTNLPPELQNGIPERKAPPPPPPPPPPTLQPTVFEIAAMTTELDTLAITSHVKEVLQFHNLGQKLFGEAVLGLSQGSVSELLSKPKPWHMLSLKGREPFIKMQMWFNDPHNIDKLRQYQSDFKVNKKRKSSTEERLDGQLLVTKKPRVFFTEEQKDMLRVAYARDPYPNQSTIESLAAELNVGAKTVVNWFHNHRMRAKQQQHSSTPTPTTPTFGVGRDHVKVEEEFSNNSDRSSGDSGQFASMHNSSGSQWCFPTFEPVRSSSRRESVNSNSIESLGDDTLNKSDLSVPSEENGDTGVAPADESNGPRMQGAPVVNKRKSANPKWVYEGTHLDKHSNIQEETTGLTPSSTPSSKEDFSDVPLEPEKKEQSEDGEKTDTDSKSGDKTPQPVDTDKSRGSTQPHSEKIEKIQKAIQSNDLDWDEIDRQGNISKLEQNIDSQPNEDWEF